MTRILVTGGAGFIGSHLVTTLVRLGHDVRVLDNFATSRRENLAEVLDEIELIEGDVQSFERVHRAVRGCEVVLHQAALPSVPRSIQDPLTSHAVNTTGTLNVLIAARDAGTRRVVFASSSSVYGATRGLPKRESMVPQPISPYAVAKLAGEGFCRSFTEVYDLETVSIRYFNVFGPRQDPHSQYAAVIPRFILALLSEEPPTIFGDGSQSRDFTYVDNIVLANLLAMDAVAVVGATLNVACGQGTSLNSLVEQLHEITGRDTPARYLDRRPGDVLHSVASIGAAQERLGFEVAVPLDEGLRRTVAYYATVPFAGLNH